MSLLDIQCQDNAIWRLQRAFQHKRLAQAYIFAGLEGTGRFLTARELAKAILCENRQSLEHDGNTFIDSCGQCRSCLLFEGNGHPDFQHIYKELVKFSSKGSTLRTSPIDLPKDVVQEYLIDRIHRRPTMSQYTVYVVSEAEKMNAFSQNAILKTLEEPPAFCTIILLCTNPERLLPTIHSRCQLLRFGSISTEIIVSRLTEQGCEKAEAQYWAGFTGGSLGKSLEAAALRTGDYSCYQMKKELIRMLLELKLQTTLELAEWIAQQVKQTTALLSDMFGDISKSDLTRRSQKMIIKMIATAVSDMLKLASGTNDIVNLDQRELLGSYAPTLDAVNAARFIEKCAENLDWVDRSVNERLNFEELLLTYISYDIL